MKKYLFIVAMAVATTGCIEAPDETGVDVESVEDEMSDLRTERQGPEFSDGEYKCQTEQNENGTTETCCYEGATLVGCYFHG